jgi:hypothetical protein
MSAAWEYGFSELDPPEGAPPVTVEHEPDGHWGYSGDKNVVVAHCMCTCGDPECGWTASAGRNSMSCSSVYTVFGKQVPKPR